MTIEHRTANRAAATPARIYDYYLGGVHHFPADRQAAHELTVQLPHLWRAAQANRAFLNRAVGYLADVGVRQFLDIGAGMPRADAVHTLVRVPATDARVAYVDIDPVAVAHTLESIDGIEHVIAIGGDLCNPAGTLHHPKVRRTVDFTKPVGLLLLDVLHYASDDAQAYDGAACLINALPTGSHVVVSHPAAEIFPPASPACQTAAGIYRRYTNLAPVVRDRDAVARFLTGLTLVDPGLVYADQWRPDQRRPSPSERPADSGMWAAVGITT